MRLSQKKTRAARACEERRPNPRQARKVAANAWLLLVLGGFLWLRIWQSESVTHLLQSFARHF
jgi:ferric-dicitrate binding protein FerR (iron transport regulator)